MGSYEPALILNQCHSILTGTDGSAQMTVSIVVTMEYIISIMVRVESKLRVMSNNNIVKSAYTTTNDRSVITMERKGT